MSHIVLLKMNEKIESFSISFDDSFLWVIDYEIFSGSLLHHILFNLTKILKSHACES